MMLQESGVLAGSVKYFHTPSGMAKKLLYYVTRCGHYHCSTEYHFSYRSEIGRLPSHNDTFLIFYILSGSMSVAIGNAEHTIIHAGQLALMDCRDIHEYYATAPMEFVWVHFDGANSRALYEQIIKNYGHLFTPADGFQIDRQLLSIVSACADERSLSEIQQSQAIYTALTSLLTPIGHQIPNTLIQKALDFMHENLANDLSVQTAAQAVGLSSSHFSRLFRRETGYAPHEYIVLQRINRAKRLLCTTNLTIKEIAFRTGYNSEANFIHAFSARVGCSPGVFRKNID